MAEEGDHSAIRNFLDVHPNASHASGEKGWTPLHRAAHFRHTRVVQLLLSSGADPSARDHGRNTPLHDAAMGHQFSVASMTALIVAGTDLNARNTHWVTPIHVAAQYANLPGFALLLAHNARVDLPDRRKMRCLEMARYQLEGLVHAKRRLPNQRRELNRIIEILEQRLA